MLLRVLIFLGCFILVSCSETTPDVDNNDIDQIRDVVRKYEDFSGHILIANQDQILFNEVFGESVPGKNMSTDERWRWASVTKQVTSVAILQVVEEGKLSLETTITEVFPNSGLPNANEITIHNLLQHTSGLINDADLADEDFIKGFDSRSYCKGPAKNSPGESFEYNNCDYIVLGQILEMIDGVSWFDSLDARIFQPAGMNSVRTGKANGGETVTGFVRPGELAPGVSLSLYEASGELVGVVSDLIKFDRALLSGNFLKPETRKLLWDSDPALGYAALGQWVFPGQLDGCEASLTIVERRGAISGIQVLNVLIPEENMSIVVFVNRDNFDWGAVWSQQGFAYNLLSAAVCSQNVETD